MPTSIQIERSKKNPNPNNNEAVPKIKWIGKSKHFVISVLDMYERDGSFYNVYVKEEDLYRLINADRGCKYGLWFDIKDEQGDLDDDTYLGISYIQARYYLSLSTLTTAKRLWKAAGKSGRTWLYLKKRIKKGGRPVGAQSKGFAGLSDAEKERIERLAKDYDTIVANMCKHDWVEEYIELTKDMCLLNNKKVPGKKKTIANFTEIRRKWLEENT